MEEEPVLNLTDTGLERMLEWQIAKDKFDDILIESLEDDSILDEIMVIFEEVSEWSRGMLFAYSAGQNVAWMKKYKASNGWEKDD